MKTDKRVFIKGTGGVFVLFVLFFFGLESDAIEPGNPLVDHIYTADPSAHVFEGRIYVYPSHDQDDATSYNMTDYHVLSSANLVDWVDHGVVLDVDDVPWAASRMWAPDCAYKDGTYYFYFPARTSDGEKRIGVATSDSPAGPFVPEDSYIEGTNEIDPAVFIDDDGQAYLYWGGNTCYVAKLDETMKQLDGEVVELAVDYFYEAAWMHKKDGIYVLSYSTKYHPDTSDHIIVYATSTSPWGPFTYQGIVNGDVSGITNHHSTVEYKGQWYLFYHNSDLSGGHDNRRSVCADYLHFNDDGSIRPVIQTDVGIGQYDGLSKIEAENYTETENVEKRENTDGGLHIVFDPDDELIFNNVDFDDQNISTIQLQVASVSSTGSLEISTTSGELLGTIPIPQTGGTQNWQTVSGQIQQLNAVNDISITYTNTGSNQLQLDWIEFSGQTSTVNLALSGTATQSSTDYGGVPERAIDDNTNGAYNGDSVTHTATEAQPWWQVDLGDSYDIDDIVIWGRTDICCQGRLSDYDVFIFDSSDTLVWSDYQADYPDPSVTLNPGGITGQYVVVQLRGTNALSLAEVEVYGDEVSPCALPWTDAGFTVNAETVNYSSGAIDISCADSVDISMDLEGVGSMEDTDYLNVYYSVDGGSAIAISLNVNAFGLKTVSAMGITGSTVEILIDGATSSSAEYYYVTNMGIVSSSGGVISQDIGDVAAAGSASESGGAYTIDGSGADIWGTADEFHYVYESLSGDGEIVARVVSVENTNSWAKAGVMIRESLDAGSKFAMVCQRPDNQVTFQWRNTTDGSADYNGSLQGGTDLPKYVRVVRIGDSLSGYYSTTSADGPWTQIGSSQTISMATDVYVGLPVTSHNDGTLCTAEIDHVTITEGSSNPNIRGEWTFDNVDSTTVYDSTAYGHDGTRSGGTIVTGNTGDAMYFDGVDDSITLPAAAFSTINDQVTVSLWVNGDAIQPVKDVLFQAVDASGNRVLNIHLPWDNSRVYWDAGNSGSSYDRIYATASASQFEGQWNHWVFVKDATTGDMTIYVNGAVFQSGTGKTMTMSGITSATLGSSPTGDNYTGSIDEVILYDVALSASEVSDLYNSY